MVKPKKDPKEMRIKYESDYFQVYNNLKNDVFILNELNKQLPKSIKELVDKKHKNFREKITKLNKKDKKDFDKIRNLLNKAIKAIKEEGKKKIIISVRGNAGKLFMDSVHSVMFSSRFNMFIRDMSLVYLIAEFESYLKNIIEILIEKKPEILISSHKTIECSELFVS